jgi:hypothetical protein
MLKSMNLLFPQLTESDVYAPRINTIFYMQTLSIIDSMNVELKSLTQIQLFLIALAVTELATLADYLRSHL